MVRCGEMWLSLCELCSNEELRYKENEFCSVRATAASTQLMRTVCRNHSVLILQSSGGGQGHFLLFRSLKAPLRRPVDGSRSSVRGKKLTRARGQKCPSLSLKLKRREQKAASENWLTSQLYGSFTCHVFRAVNIFGVVQSAHKRSLKLTLQNTFSSFYSS